MDEKDVLELINNLERNINDFHCNEIIEIDRKDIVLIIDYIRYLERILDKWDKNL